MDLERYALQFHHLGLAVREPERALRFLRGLGYLPGPACYDPLQRVNLCLCVPDETAVPRPAHPPVELIYPEPGVGSPIDAIFAKGDELIYHLCYDFPNPKASLAAIERDGNRVLCISTPKPAVLFDQREVGFWYVRGFGMIEILARAPRLGRAAMTLPQILAEASTDKVVSVIAAVRRADALAHELPSAARIAVLRNLTLESIEPFLKYHCYRDGIRPELYFGGYDTPRQELLDPRSALHEHAPDLVVLALLLEHLAPTCNQPGWRAGDIREQLGELLDLACERAGALVVMNTFLPPFRSELGFAVPADRSDLSSQIEDLNRMLRNVAAARPGRMVVIDWERPVRVLGEAASIDYRYWYLARSPFRPAFLNLYAHELAKVVRALKGKAKKVLALDCDNTLWGGVVGEDGLAGIELNPHDFPGKAYHDFQAAVLQLVARGVLVVLCSKNNPDEVWEVLDRHPHCLLKREHLAAWRIDWNDKSANLVALAAELNLGLDSFVFVDDAPAECERVGRSLPQVVVARVPDERSLLPGLLFREGWFDTLHVSQEDRHRLQALQQDANRRQERLQVESLDDYLASLEMVARIHPAQPVEIARVAQLTQKTNQFNLTTRRYAAAEVEALARAEGSRVFALAASDRFGDLGLVGVLVARRAGGVAEVDTLLLSCRALGRDLEFAFVHHCLAQLAALWPVERFEAEYIATPRNAQVADFWERVGFARLASTDGGARYALHRAQLRPVKNTPMRILEDV